MRLGHGAAQVDSVGHLASERHEHLLPWIGQLPLWGKEEAGEDVPAATAGNTPSAAAPAAE